MAKIYISYSNDDKNVFNEMAETLREFKYEVSDETSQNNIQDWKSAVRNAIRQVDGMIVIISKNSEHSQTVLTEIGAGLAYVEDGKLQFIIPVIFDNAPIPVVLNSLKWYKGDRSEIKAIVWDINVAMESFFQKKAIDADIRWKQLEIEKKQLGVITKEASSYVLDALTDLKKKEDGYKLIAYSLYVIAALVIVLGVVLSAWAALFEWGDLTNSHTFFGVGPTERQIFISLRLFVIIGLVIGLSRYCFILGKSFMIESLKNADRQHAIKFGQFYLFYLSSYGGNLNWAEVKEAFQHWNIDKVSGFNSLSADQFDPKFTESIVKVAQATMQQKENKEK